MSRMNNLEGIRFGRLIAIEPTARYKNGEVIWRCKCDCGNETNVRSGNLRNKHTLSCGCYHDNAPRFRQTKHGGWGTRLYYVWKDMRGRCECEYRREYKYYGAKGVSVCDEWQDFGVFRKWALDNGYDENAKRGECTIDRIDPFGNYEPNNCRWITISFSNYHYGDMLVKTPPTCTQTSTDISRQGEVVNIYSDCFTHTISFPCITCSC